MMNPTTLALNPVMTRRMLLVAGSLAITVIGSTAVPTGLAAEPSAPAGGEGDRARHEEHARLANDFTHVDLTIPDRIHSVTAATRLIMGAVVGHYLELKDALVAGDTASADQAAARMADAVARVPSFELAATARRAWSQHAAVYESQLSQLQRVRKIAAKRSYFAHISEIVYCTLKSFDMANRRMFVDYCVMAFDGKGAYWLSADEEIQNPYFGRAMLGCGEIRETLQEYWRSPR